MCSYSATLVISHMAFPAQMIGSKQHGTLIVPRNKIQTPSLWYSIWCLITKPMVLLVNVVLTIKISQKKYISSLF